MKISASTFHRYFSNFYKNRKNTFAFFKPRNVPKFHYYHLFTWFTFGTLVMNYNKMLNYQQSSSSNGEGITKYETKKRLVFIKNKNNAQDPDLDLFIQSLKKNGVDVVEVDLSESSDYIASLLHPKDLNFIAINDDGDVLEVPNGDKNAKLKLMSFFKSVKVLDKEGMHNFYQCVDKLRENERIIFSYIPEKKDYVIGSFNNFDDFNKSKIKNLVNLSDRYKKVKNSHLSYTSSFFIIKDPHIAQLMQIGQDDIGEVYIMKKSSLLNNFETNTRINGTRVQINRMDYLEDNQESVKKNPKSQEEIIKRKLYENSLDYINYFQTPNELNNIRHLLKQLGINKVFIYYRSNNDQNFAKILTKLVKVRKDMKRDDFCILATNNLGTLQKEFQMLHDGFTNSFRFIDYSKPVKWEAPKDYEIQVINLDTIDKQNNEELTNSDPKASSSSNIEFNSPFRSIFEEKPTRKRIKNYLNKALDGNLEVYYETEPRSLSYYSRNLIGKRFENDVLKNEQDILIEFFKPTCPSCSALSVGYEGFAKTILEIQDYINLLEKRSDSDLAPKSPVVDKYKIQNLDKFKNLRVYRYNIYNESEIFPSPAATPLIFLFKNHQKGHPLLIDLVEAKVNLTDSEKVIRYLIRRIDEN